MNRRDFLRKAGLGALALTMVGAKPDSIFSPEPEVEPVVSTMPGHRANRADWIPRGTCKTQAQTEHFWHQLMNEPAVDYSKSFRVSDLPERTTAREVAVTQEQAEERVAASMEALGKHLREHMEKKWLRQFELYEFGSKARL